MPLTLGGFITTVRLWQADEDLSGATIVKCIAELLQPAVWFSCDLGSVTALHSEFWNFLDRRGANITQHPSLRILMTLATNIYDKEDDGNAAVDIFRDIITAGGRSPSQVAEAASSIPIGPPSTTQMKTFPSEKFAHNVDMRFQERDKKLAGELGQYCQEYVDDYRQVARDYKMNQEQKLRYLHKLMQVYAKRYYLDVVDGYATTFQQAVDLVERECTFHARQNKVKNLLKSLRLSKFVTEGIDRTEALARVYKSITRIFRQAPISH